MKAARTARRALIVTALGGLVAGVAIAAGPTAKAPFIRMADRYALLLIPVALLISGVAWWLSGDPVRAVAALVTATPCPLILAVPAAFIGGTSLAAVVTIVARAENRPEWIRQREDDRRTLNVRLRGA